MENISPFGGITDTPVWTSGPSFKGRTDPLLVCSVDTQVFHSLYKVGRNGNFVFKGFNNSKKKLPPVGLDLMLQITTGLRVQCLYCKKNSICTIYNSQNCVQIMVFCNEAVGRSF